MKCYHCGEFGHRKSQCPVLDRIMNAWRSKGGGKDKGKGKGAWKGDWGRSQWSSGWKGGSWSSDAYHHGHGKAKGKGDKGKGKGLYALDGSPSAEASWWDEEVAFGLFDEHAEDKQDAKVMKNTGDLPRGSPPWTLGVRNRFDELTLDDDGDDAEEDEYPKLEDVPKMTEKKVKMPWFKLESSRQGQKKKDKKMERDINDMLNYLDIDDEPDETEESMKTVGESWNGSGGEWVKVASVVDSGAAENVASRETAPNVRIMPSAGSRRGQKYITAKGDVMVNEGEQSLKVMTEEGATTDITFQITDVRRPLCSVVKICDRGN